MRNPVRVLALLTLIATAPACDDADMFDGVEEPDPEEVFGPQWRGWGFGKGAIRMNTNVVNGAAVNTVRFGYPTSYGQEVTNVYVPTVGWLDSAISTLEVVDGEIIAEKNGLELGALHFDGSLWLLEVDGEFAYMVLDDVRRAGNVGLSNYGAKQMTNLDPDRFVYKWTSPYAPTAGTKVDAKTGWGGSYDGLHTCAQDGNGDVWTVFSRGLLVDENSGDVAEASWAPHQYAYIACLSGAVGKTMMWGYSHDNPEGGLPNVTLPEYESALRGTRADYCGDGKSYTKPGEAVTLLDHWGINEHSVEAVNDEAVFGPEGALCVDTPRFAAHQAPIQCTDGTIIPRCKTLKHCYGYPTWTCTWNYASDVFDDHPDALIWTRNAAF